MPSSPSSHRPAHLRLHPLLLAAALSTLPTPLSHATIFRWDNGQPIPGTSGITLSPNQTAPSLDLAFANLSSSNLSSSFFANSSLVSAHLLSSNLTFVSFRNANLTAANLSGATVTSTSFDSAIVAAANFSRDVFGAAPLTYTQLFGTASYQSKNLGAVSFARCDLSSFKFPSCNLTGANFTSATLAGDFSSANLTSANLSFSTCRAPTLTAANLTGADITGITFTRPVFGTAITAAQMASTASYQSHSLAGVTFTACNLGGFNLAGQNLAGSNFSSSEFALASFASANLADVNFSAANFFSTNISAANLSRSSFGIALTSAQLAATTNYAIKDLSSVNFTNNDLSSAKLTSFNLISTNLTGASLASANLAFTDLRNASGYNPLPSTITRGQIAPDGTIAPFTFNPGENLLINSNTLSASTTATIIGPSTGSAAILLYPSAHLLLAPTPLPTSNVLTLANNISLRLDGTSSHLTTVQSTAPTAAPGQPRSLLPTLTILSAPTVTSNNAPLGSRIYYSLLDFGTNDALIRNGSLINLRDMARAFLASAGTQGLGSSSAIPNTRLAVLSNSNPDGTPYVSTFDGVPATTTDILARFTYTGDTNLDGILDGQDLANLLEGLSTGGTGWQSGDLNYDGLVDTTDFSFFTTAYNAYLANPIPLGSPTDAGQGPNGSVPEPASLTSLLPLALLSRRRRT